MYNMVINRYGDNSNGHFNTNGFYKAIFTGFGFPTFGAVLALFGLYLMTFGLIADQISQLRLQKFYQN